MKKVCLTFAFASLFTSVFAQFNKAKLDSFLITLADKNKGMMSVAISKNGNIEYTKATGFASISEQGKIPATTKTKYRIGSITKMFTGVIIFRLIEQNKLSLDDKLEKFFPAIPNAATITIGNMLNHQSGIHNFTDDSLFLTYHQQKKSEAEMLGIIRKPAADFEPGAKSSYSNANFVLLGYIAQKITGKTYAQLVANIASEIGLADTYVGGKPDINNNESYSYTFLNEWKQENITDMSIPGAAGAIVSTPTDLVKFIDALFSGKLISSSSLEKMKTITDGYGMAMFEIPFFERKALGHNGGIDGFSSMLAHFPTDNVSVAYSTNGQVYPGNDVIIGILSIYFDKPYTIPSFSTYAVNAADLDIYTGVYASKQIPLKITISKEGTTLIAQATGQSSFPLEPVSKDIFKFDRAGVVLEFTPADKSFVLKQGGGTFTFSLE